jgi:tetratricopeptide (TPR) repeat protein
VIRFRLYNPAHLSSEERKAAFVARHDILDLLVRLVREQRPDAPCQHILIIGQRGMGKTTLGLRLLDAVEDDPGLARVWQPVPFAEESYGINDLADLWLTALRHLSERTRDPRWAAKAKDLQAKERDAERLEAYALAALRDFPSETGKRLILFVENLDTIFARFADKDEVHGLRATLMERHELLLIGTANSVFEAIRFRGQPLYEFFRLVRLEGLERDETRAMLLALARQENNEDVADTLEHDPGRVEVVRRLTGGNPRLLTITYRLLTESPLGDVREDLERLMDEQTYYFKLRIEELPAQALRAFHCLAERWHPLLAREVAECARLSSSQASAQLRQLESAGYVRKAGPQGGEKRVRYELSERFYNIYYLMRFARDARQRLERLIEFLRDLFGRRAMARLYRSTLEVLRAGREIDTEAAHLLEIVGKYVAGDENFLEGKDWLREALDLSVARNFDPAHLLGYAIDVLGDEAYATPEVERAIEAGLEKHPDDPRYLAALGAVEWRRGRLTEAEAAWRKAVEVDPKRADAWHNLGALLLQANRLDEAEEAWRRAVDEDPKLAVAWFNMGVRLHETGRVEEAEAAWRKAVEANPKLASAWNRLGIGLREKGRRKEAETAWKKALYSDPNYFSALANLANTYEQEERFDEAEAMWRRAVQTHPKEATAWFNLGVLLDRMGRVDEAEAAWRKALDSNPKFASAWNRLGIVLQQKGRTKEAETAWKKALDSYPEYLSALGNLANAYEQAERFEEAEALWRSAVEAHPNNASAWFNLGVLLWDIDRLDEAEDAWRKSVEVDPKIASAWNRIGIALQRKRRMEEAERAWRKALESFPEYPAAWANLGNALAKGGRLDEAEAAWWKAVEADPKSAGVWLNLGNQLWKTGRFDEAEKAWRRAVDADPNLADAWHNLGVCLYRRSQPDEAEAAWRKAVEANPKLAVVWFGLGVLLRGKGRINEAEGAWRKAVEADPKQVDAWFNLGLRFQETGRLDEAETAWRKATEADPSLAPAWNNLGLILSRSGRLTEAEAAHRKAVELHPNEAITWNGLAWNLFLQGDTQKLREAEDCARRSAQLAPENAYSLHTLSDILGRLGSWNEALAHLKDAVAKGGREFRENASADLIRSFIAAAAAGHAASVKEIIEQNALAERFEPLWHAVRLELGEHLEPLPAEIMDAVKEVRQRVGRQRQEQSKSLSAAGSAAE